VRGEVAVLKGSVEKLRVLMQAERLTKAMMVGQPKGEMPPDMWVMPMEPPVKSMATAEGDREFTTGEGWRCSQHRHQECDEPQPAMSCHAPSPLAMFVTPLERDARSYRLRAFRRARYHARDREVGQM
jgi:hypothetical protein